MPTYEYECCRCGHHFEVFQKMSDEPRKRCPKCRGKVKRMLGTGAGIIFKGSGFYATDYRSEGYRKAEASDKKAPSVTESSKTATSKESTPKQKAS